jgi:hypothetical protein
MAEQVASMPTLGRSPRYPWATWLNGQTWRLTKGEDFKTEAENFRAQVYIAAKARGLAAHTSRNGDELFIQAVPEND